MRQASRRSWRIGQTEPVQVVFMAYRNTLQADALKLVAQKLQSSLAVEGELPEDGLAAYGDDGDDLMLALARKIVAGENDAGSVESVFAQAQQVAAEAEALLVDEGWHAPEPEPELVAAAAAVATESVTDAVASEPQRSLFSWAEFLADAPEAPLLPRGRQRHEAPTLSLFEWARDREQEGGRAGGRSLIGGRGTLPTQQSPLPPMCGLCFVRRSHISGPVDRRHVFGDRTWPTAL